MAIFNIRNLLDKIHTRLRPHAAKTGRIVETRATEPEDTKMSVEALQLWVDQLYGDHKPSHVVADLIAERREEAAKE